LFVLQDYHSPIWMNCTKKLWMCLLQFHCTIN